MNEKLGSHNSWSFGKTEWYIPAFTCRCQKLNIQEQYNRGIRLFDLRIRFKDYKARVAHGLAIFDVNIDEDLAWLNDKKDCYVRVLLEYNAKPKHFKLLCALFRNVCGYMKMSYQNITFFGGYAKWNHNIKIYNFNTEEPKLIDRYSSTTSWFDIKNKFLAILDDWWPWLYAKFHNKKNYAEFVENNQGEWLFIDFVDML